MSITYGLCVHTHLRMEAISSKLEKPWGGGGTVTGRVRGGGVGVRAGGASTDTDADGDGAGAGVGTGSGTGAVNAAEICAEVNIVTNCAGVADCADAGTGDLKGLVIPPRLPFFFFDSCVLDFALGLRARFLGIFKSNF